MIKIPENFINKPKGYPKELEPKEIKKRFLSLLGEFKTPSVPLNIKVTDEKILKGNIVKQKIEYDVESGERISAFHLFPKNSSKNTPGIISIHAHGGEDIFPVGKDYHCHPNPDDPVQYSYILALSGFRVLAPDSLCFGERQTKWGYSTYLFDEINAHMELTARGKSLCWKSVWDNSRAIKVLEFLGAKSIGSIGWSGGSTQAYILAAVNEKIKASVCFFSFMTLRHQFYQYRLGHCLYHFIPGMIESGIDWDQVVSLIPPRKIFLGWGAKDKGTPESMYKAFVNAIENRCRKENIPKSIFLHEELNCGHIITKKMLKNAVNFLQINLKSIEK
jgi:dienelactone hydrolase